MSREALEKVLVPGGAFRMLHEFTDEGQKRRLFFILNREPQGDSELFLVTATSQVGRRLRHRGPEPVVVISPEEYGFLSCRSAIDCAAPLIRPRSELFARAREPDFEPLDPLPCEILRRLRYAVDAARTVTRAQKVLVLGSEDP